MQRPAHPGTSHTCHKHRSLRHPTRCSTRTLLPILFTMLLMLSGQSAQAQWDMLGRNEHLRLYIDRTPVQRQGDIATVWQMLDYTSAQWIDNRVIMSVRHLVEYDCRERRARTIGMAAYSEQLGQGREILSERQPDAEWVEVPAAGSGPVLLNAACGSN